jgi:hypothetical protein
VRGRLLVAAAAATALAAGPVGPAAAATPAPAPVPGQFTVAPAPGPDGQARGYFQLSVGPGGSATDVVVFGNDGAVADRLRVGVTDGLTAVNSGSAYGALGGACAGAACWVVGIPPTVTLPPHTQEQLTFRVTVPPGTRPAQYLAGITATPDGPGRPVPVKTSRHASTQVIVVPRVVIGVAVTVGALAKLPVKTEITGVTADWIDGLVRLTVRVRNTGQRFTKGTGTISCGSGRAMHSFGLFMDTVLPGQGAGLPVNAVGLRPGAWPCTVRIKAVGGGTATWAGTVTVPGTVPAATRRIADGDYVVPAGGIPGWAVVLMVLGGLIVLSLWAVLLRRERDRKLGNRGGDLPGGSRLASPVGSRKDELGPRRRGRARWRSPRCRARKHRAERA